MAFSPRFSGFSEAAFEAFEPRKWSSNLYNLERMAVRDQLAALQTILERSLFGEGIQVKASITPHVPSIFNSRKVSELVLYFTRTEAEQKAILPLLDRRLPLPEQISDAAEHHRHACLAVRIYREAVESGLMLHSTAWLDVMNLLNRCRNPTEQARFIAMVRGLGPEAIVRISPTEEVRAEDFEALHLNTLEEAVLNDTFLIFFGRRDLQGSPVVRSEAFVEPCRRILSATIPLYHFILWRPSSDYLEIAHLGKGAQGQTQAEAMPLKPSSKVKIISGPFRDREGLIIEMDHKGFVRVLIGKVTIRIEPQALRPL